MFSTRLGPDLLHYMDGFVQERRNSSALAMELCLSCTDPSNLYIYRWWFVFEVVSSPWNLNGISPSPINLLTTGDSFFKLISFLMLFIINVIFFYEIDQIQCIWSALWTLMAWCFSTRAAIATVLSMHPCISRCLWVNKDTRTGPLMSYAFLELGHHWFR